MSRLPSIAIAVFTVWIAADQLRLELQFARFNELAQRIETGIPTDIDYWRMFDDRAPAASAFTGACNDPGVQNRLTVELTKLETMLRSSNTSSQITQDTITKDAARKAIACAPMDGGVWFQFAQLTMNSSGLTPDVVAAFQLSDRLAPAEGWLIPTRAPLYAYLSEHGHREFAKQAETDMLNYTAYGHDPLRTFNWVAGWPEMFHDSVLAGMQALTPRERSWYYAVARRMQIDVGEPKNELILRDPFTGLPISNQLVK